MQVTIDIPEQLAVQARARGVSVEVYARDILTRQALGTAGEHHVESIHAAIERILDLRKGNKLAGLRTEDLIHEGHKY
ncbi:MAG: hypothetical protein WAM71_13865 [Candidatus Korobacteraceae bacterium]